MPQTVLDALKEKIIERKALRETSAIKGSAQSWDDYRYLIGVIRGLDVALEEIEGLAKNQLEDDDEE
jgi:hypothetical protein